MNTVSKDVDVSSNPLILPRMEKKAPRAYLVGMTDSGKSTLMEVLMKNYMEAYSIPKLPVLTLIVDSKPRFKAELELNGLLTKTTGRYRRWGYGSEVIPGSYVLPRIQHPKKELDQAWRLGGTIAIVQSESKNEWDELAETARIFFEGYGAKQPRLLIVDELADFYERRLLTDIFQRVARNGRERDFAFIAGSQRPRKVPVETMTEMLRLYLFKLDFDEDLDHIIQFGLPWKQIPKWQRKEVIPGGHVFYMWDRKLEYDEPSNKYYELDLGNTNYWTGQLMKEKSNEGKV